MLLDFILVIQPVFPHSPPSFKRASCNALPGGGRRDQAVRLQCITRKEKIHFNIKDGEGKTKLSLMKLLGSY